MTEDQIHAAEERLRRAMLGSDVAELENLLAPDLLFTSFLGELLSKEQDLEAHGSGVLQIHGITLSDRQIRLQGELAIVNCQARIDASFDDDRSEQDFRFMRVWAPGPQGQLQVIAGQATLVYATLDR